MRHSNERPVYAPLFIYTIPFLRPKQLSQCEKFNLRYPSPDLLTTTADKLRYYRYQKALLQQDVADYAGIDRSTYISYEDTNRDAYPPDKLRIIAEFLQVDIINLLDGYNQFLMAQGQNLKALRKERHMTQTELAKLLGVNAGTVKKWERGVVSMSKEKWEKLLQIGG
jgi:transcriptional regulator with XRE-family HTH domain